MSVHFLGSDITNSYRRIVTIKVFILNLFHQQFLGKPHISEQIQQELAEQSKKGLT